jgi:predicted DNA-binding WGR domain protein
MYALKTASMEVLEELLPHLRVCRVEETDSLGLLHHAVALDPVGLHAEGAASYDSTAVVEAVVGLGRPSVPTAASLVQLAGRVGAARVGRLLARRYGGRYDADSLQPPGMEEQVQGAGYDHKVDAHEMMTTLEKEAEKKQLSSKNVSKKTQTGCTVTEGHILEEHSVLLTKIDVSLGAWGLYNFYRLQIWKDAHKELYVLFTNWGRIERHGHGQYQNTPFSTAAEAKAEFSKIFQAKTGNKWEELAEFVEKPRKYRLVAVELSTKVIRPAVNVDLKTTLTSSLPPPILKLVGEAADPAMLAAAYSSGGHQDTGAVPFGRIRREVVLKARHMLVQMAPLVEQREKLNGKKYTVEGEKQDKLLAELAEVTSSLCRLSSEYYHIVPKPGFEFERVTPVDSSSELASEEHRLHLILEFEAAKAMVLGAMLRRREVSRGIVNE